MTKPKKPDLARDWLQHHARGFELARRQCERRRAQQANWFRSQAERCSEAIENLSNGIAKFQTSNPLLIEGARPRSWQGKVEPLTAYMALEATLQPNHICETSLKLGLFKSDRKLIFRLIYDYDQRQIGFNGFPFHVQWGKNPGEVKGSSLNLIVGYEEHLDEPRLPAVPVDFFQLLQIVHEQFAGPVLTQDLQSDAWTRMLRESTVFAGRRWCQAIDRCLDGPLGLLEAARQTNWPTISAFAT